MRLLLVNLLLLLFLSACTKKSDYKTEINNIEVNQLIKIDSSIVKFYLPFKKTLEESLMNTPISYSFETYKKNDGELNSTLSNMFGKTDLCIILASYMDYDFTYRSIQGVYSNMS